MIPLLRGTARSRDTRFRVHDNGVHFNQTVLCQRSERQNACRRKASRVADDLGPADLFAVKLSQPVDALRLRMRMRHMVPLLVNSGIAEAIIRPQINDADRELFQCFPDFHRMSMGQADEHEITVLADARDIFHALQLQIIKPAKMRIQR